MKPIPDRPSTSGERWILAAFALFFLAAIAAELSSDFSPTKLSVVFMVLFVVPLTVLHEAGHAVVASLLGWRVCRVVIGVGRPRLNLSVRGVPVEVRTVPLGGFVVPAPVRPRSPRLESFLVYSAGLAAECVVASLALWGVGWERAFTPSEDLVVIAAQGVALVVALDVFTNLLPLPTDDGGVTDGLGMLTSPFLSDAHFARAATLPWVLEARAFEEAERHDAAARIWRHALTALPGNPFVKLRLAVALAATGHGTEAQELLDEALASPLAPAAADEEYAAIVERLRRGAR